MGAEAIPLGRAAARAISEAARSQRIQSNHRAAARLEQIARCLQPDLAPPSVAVLQPRPSTEVHHDPV